MKNKTRKDPAGKSTVGRSGDARGKGAVEGRVRGMRTGPGPAPGRTAGDTAGRARQILEILKGVFPDAKTPLTHHSPFELLVATILSAQCTDVRVNIVTKDLFLKYRSVQDFASAQQEELERDVHSTGFFRMKAKNIIACAKALLERHQGNVPPAMAELTKLPGVGRKTANVVLSEAFGTSEGIVVDTHVHRVSRRLGLTTADDPERIEQDLMRHYSKDSWGTVGLLLILHGRAVCKARTPLCAECPLASLCPSAFIAS